MGKTQKKSRVSTSIQAANPLGRPRKEQEEVLDEEKPKETLQRISSQLQDASPESKECGLQSLSLLVDKHAEEVVKQKIVRIVAPLMVYSKSHPNVRHSAIGSLKNLSLVSADICDEMVQQDVMTPLCALLKSYSEADWTPHDKKASSDQDQKRQDEVIDSFAEIFIEGINLLWNLCEANPVALSIFNDAHLIDILLKHLANVHGKFGPSILLPVLQCIYTVTEDNKILNARVKENQILFEAILNGSSDFCQDPSSEPSKVYMQILSLGIVLNIHSSDAEVLNEKILPNSIHLIATALDMDQRKMCNEFTSLCPLRNGESRNEEASMEVEGPMAEKIDEFQDSIGHAIHAQQTALEILTNICCGSDDGSNDWEEINESDQSDDNLSLCASDTMEDAGDAMQPQAFLDNVLPGIMSELMLSKNIVQKVISKANLPSENVCQILSTDAKPYGGEMVLRMLSTLRIRSFLCLNNLVSVLSTDELGGSENLFEIWTSLGKLCFSNKGETDLELLESAMTAMRAVTQRLVDCKSLKFGSVTLEDLHNLLRVGSQSSKASVRMNIVHISGNVGSVIVTNHDILKEQQQLLHPITDFLCQAAAKDVNLRVVAESLDKLFDIFGEDYTDLAFKNFGVLPKLKQLLPGLKTKIAMQKSKLNEEDFSLVMMAKTNLVRFIKYKEKRGLK